MKNHAIRTLPHVSFIIPTLNAGHILPRALDAIRNQNYPQTKVEIIISDGGSTDNTREIARKYKAKIIANPEVLHEPGKSRAARVASGEIIFYTDADNVLAHNNWLRLMTRPYLKEKHIAGFLPQTIAAPDTNPVDRYLGHLFTDPLTWFLYYPSASPEDLEKTYRPHIVTPDYLIYTFPTINPPLFGLSQGVGTTKSFRRTGPAYADDMLAGIKLIRQKGRIAYVPNAGVYHYHVSGLRSFIRKYTWRLRNNLTQKVQGMGIIHRRRYFSTSRTLRLWLFIPYACSVLLPFIDSVKLSFKYRDPVMLLHTPMTCIMAMLIVWETAKFAIGTAGKVGRYE